VIGGIISSTFLTLLLLPVLYDWVERPGRVKEISEQPQREVAVARAVQLPEPPSGEALCRQEPDQAV
ncbi:MAG TPA: hypothetical protein VH229_10840, partial [Candidatus Udaeobacter sp.]|nr:hypothetical protein [Candidatus Udaeobacter sp.]